MNFAPEGRNLIAGAAGLTLTLFAAAWWLGWPWGIIPVVVGLGGLLFTLYFFRDPLRTPPAEAAEGLLLLSPADGKVLRIDDIEETTYLHGPAKRISIFLSPLNVHVNRIPADGVIEHVEYIPGEYLVAWHPKASEKNERSEIGLRHPGGRKILFKQIAGAVARRIVYHVRKGDRVKAGDRYGIVKFGSRMDVIFPPDVQVEVRPYQIVKGGLSILGRMETPSVSGHGSTEAAIRQESS